MEPLLKTLHEGCHIIIVEGGCINEDITFYNFIQKFCHIVFKNTYPGGLRPTSITSDTEINISDVEQARIDITVGDKVINYFTKQGIKASPTAKEKYLNASYKGPITILYLHI